MAKYVKRESLIVLSLPFQRLIRSHYAPWLIEKLTEFADVLVVSPFAADLSFRSAIPNLRVSHVAVPPTHEGLPRIYRKLLAISNIMRVQGFWCRHRDSLTYYWETRHVELGVNGRDTFAPVHKRFLKDVLAWIGSWPVTWRLIDRLIGQRVYNLQGLSNHIQGYENVTLIQASSWGEQDQALAWIARRDRWRAILLPYTTDQLYCNGFLYCDYDAVCVQGPEEERFATNLHAVEPQRIVEFGSLNFYSIRRGLEDLHGIQPKDPSCKHILVVGVSATYFPSESEFSMLESILEAMEEGVFGDVSVTYRPVPQCTQIEEAIAKRFTGRSARLTIEYAPPAALGLGTLSNPDAISLAVNHVNAISGYTVAVMAGTTTLALDLSLMGTPSIAYLGDPSGILESRKTHLRFAKDGILADFGYVPVVLDKPSLTHMVNRLLRDESHRKLVARQICDAWDYPLINPEQRLESLLARLCSTRPSLKEPDA